MSSTSFRSSTTSSVANDSVRRILQERSEAATQEMQARDRGVRMSQRQKTDDEIKAEAIARMNQCAASSIQHLPSSSGDEGEEAGCKNSQGNGSALAAAASLPKTDSELFLMKLVASRCVSDSVTSQTSQAPVTPDQLQHQHKKLSPTPTQRDSLATYCATPITTHYSLNNQLWMAFESYFENRLHTVAYVIGLQFLETALVEIPKHGDFDSTEYTEERMANSGNAVRASGMLQTILDQQREQHSADFGMDVELQLQLVKKLNALALEQAALEQNVEASFEDYETNRAELEAELHDAKNMSRDAKQQPPRRRPQSSEPQRPGAYSGAPGAGYDRNNSFRPGSLYQRNYEAPDEQEYQGLPQNRNSSITIGSNRNLLPMVPMEVLVEARCVDEEMGDDEQHIPKPLVEAEAVEQERCGRFGKKRNFFLVCFLLAVASGLTLAVTCTTGKCFSRNDSSTTTTTEPPSSVYTPNSTVSPTKQIEIGNLPPYSVEAMRDPHSPQSRAYDWLIEDLSRNNYTDERLLQRFALATLFFSTSGVSWKDSTNWISHEDHECTWFTLRDARYYPEHTGNPCSGDDYIYLTTWKNGLIGSLPEELALLT